MQTSVSAKVSCANEGQNFRATRADCSYSENMRKEGV